MQSKKDWCSLPDCVEHSKKKSFKTRFIEDLKDTLEFCRLILFAAIALTIFSWSPVIVIVFMRLAFGG
jgi:hypothetical protein